MENKLKNLTPPTIPAGFMELDPIRQVHFSSVLEAIEAEYRSCGFIKIDTPVLEYSSVLLAKAGGETEKQIYRFTKGDSDYSMRFDLTVPLARFVAKNHPILAFPFRRYQIGKVYRGERPQKGRFREFYQADIDIVGENELSVLADAEMAAVISRVFTRLGLNDFIIKISNRKIFSGFLEGLALEKLSSEIGIIIDKLSKIGEDKVVCMLGELGIEKSKIDKLLEFISITDIKKLEGLKGYSELKELIEAIEKLGVKKQNYCIDLKIVRGLDYYTGSVFETFIKGHESVGSVCSGGRYDNLAGYYTDKKLPGVGVSIGVTRLFDKLESELKKPKMPPSILVVSADDSLDGVLEATKTLRDKGLVAIPFTTAAKMKVKFRYAERIGTSFLAIIGESERKTNTITIKNIITGQQTDCIKPEDVILITKDKARDIK